MQGMADVTPDLPAGPDALRERAMESLSEEAYGYLVGSAGEERTPGHNRAAFSDHRLVPRVLRDVEERDLSVDLFGETLPAPVLLAPLGVQSILHEDAELATARGAVDAGVPFVLSSASSETMEDVADAADEAADSASGGAADGALPRWFQLYWAADRAIAESFVDRAAAADYSALVVTLDTPMLGWRDRDIDDAYLPFLDGEGVANYFADPAFRDRLGDDPEANELAAVREFVDVFGDPSLEWSDLEWLCEYADLPVVPKGILHPDDARAAVDAGAAGVVVSNHGGRQVDNAVAALDALPGVVDAVGDEVPVLFDSGIRRGSDVLVALALGADAVLLGRPYAYGLSIAGADGVSEVCRNLLADLDLTMGLCGVDGVADVDGSLLASSAADD